MKTIGVDVGGTFTDIVYCDMDTGQVAIHKVSTTPRRSVTRHHAGHRARSAATTASRPGDIDYVLHGTTTATNAVLEHKGARAGMVTNQGFRDIIHIARHQRVEHYSIMQELPWQSRPLVQAAPPQGREGQARSAARRGTRAARRGRRASRRRAP